MVAIASDWGILLFNVCLMFYLQFNLSWAAPPDPNVIVLKYEIKIIHVNEEVSSRIQITVVLFCCILFDTI